MTYLAAALTFVCLYLAWQLWTARKDAIDEREGAALERTELLRRFHYERQGLLNRIQMPEVGVSQALAEEADGLERHLAADGSPYEDQQYEEFIEDGLRQRGIEIDG